ncbi:MAG: sel1 repeat family protein [Magnetococcales bacterium]|nr:sel1 repeat family protein [Magnetococcales bacterium]MBF0115560.1 sel1 repeat family protein [Magnetococcales bacterium]
MRMKTSFCEISVAIVLISIAYGGAAIQQERMEALLERANHGDQIARIKLGLRHWLGIGTHLNSHEAARWYLSAAEDGHSGAQTIAGLLYTLGQGVERSQAQAVVWLNRASAGM